MGSSAASSAGGNSLAYLSGFEQQGGEAWREENNRYLADHLRRFQVTLAALKARTPSATLLELGSPPYFLTIALARCGYQVYPTTAVCPRTKQRSSRITLVNRRSGESHSFSCKAFNVEIDDFPYPAHSFDLVLCCELIEHLELDPTHMLVEIHRVLKPGGELLLTTPNVLALRNLVRLFRHRKNIYGPYSGYGVYGRHNREWTLEELTLLVTGCGFSVRLATAADTYPHPPKDRVIKRMFPFTRDMLLLRASPTKPAHRFYPSELYDSSWTSRDLNSSLVYPVPSIKHLNEFDSPASSASTATGLRAR